MAPDRAAAWACNCLWSGGGGDRDGRSTSGRWTNTGRRAVQTWSAACEVGCRHHPSPGSGETSPAGTKAMSGLPSGIQVRSSGPQREQSSSSSDDNGLERRTCRPSPRAARPGGRSPPTSWRSWPVPVSQSPRSGLWCHDREGCRGGLEHAQQPLERPQIALVLHTFQAATGGPGRRGVIYSTPQPDRVNSTDRVNSIRPCLRDELVDAATVRADHAWLPRHDRSWLGRRRRPRTATLPNVASNIEPAGPGGTS
jgi:hypothetical protein